MASPSVTQASRRRQRSTRLTVSVGLLLIAALVVVGAVLTGSWAMVVFSSVLALGCGAASTRITYTELCDTRRDAAADRAAQAKDYLILARARSAEHDVYVTGIEGRIAERQQCLEELEGALGSAQKRAATATRKKNSETRRAATLSLQVEESQTVATDAALRAAELEQELTVLRSELDAVTVAWRAADGLRKHA
jgi:hypothetical protein